MHLALLIPADLRPNGLLFMIIPLAPSAIANTIDSIGFPSIYIEIIDVRACSSLRFKQIKKLFFGISALSRGSIPAVA